MDAVSPPANDLQRDVFKSVLALALFAGAIRKVDVSPGFGGGNV